MFRIYNTLTKKKEIFNPIDKGKVSMYTCGPTVYDYVHIGNLRSYVTADTLKRWLIFNGYEVKSIKNITDVGHLTDDDLLQGDSGEDKMIKKAKKEKKDPLEIARFYEEAAKLAEQEIGNLPPNYSPRATEHIKQMIEIIEILLEKGYAYEVNGNVFFDVLKFKEYGKLSGNTIDQLEIGKRLQTPHPDKKNQWDFALWLKAPKNHLMKWDSPWGMGYPGWHIECSAMSTEYLGDTLDIHTGGEDNIFPHHEAEIAQSESATGKKFVNYWVHTRFLLVDGQKMSKSKGNFYILEDIKKMGYSPKDLRFLFMMSHYRSQMNFTKKSLKQAQKNLNSIHSVLERLNSSTDATEKTIKISKFISRADEAMNDDLNTPKLISIILELVSKTNKSLDKSKHINKNDIIKFIKDYIEKVLGINLEVDKNKIPEKVLKLAQKRQEARQNKNFELSDELRAEINKLGFSVKDTKTGFEIIKNKPNY